MEGNSVGKILLVLGSSGGNQEASSFALEMAALLKAKLVILSIVDKALVQRMKRFTDKRLSELEIEIEEKGWRELYHVEELSKERGIVTVGRQKSGVVEKVIVNEAERLKADLIVMGYPPRTSGRAKRLVQGHIERVIENAGCSVLIAK